MPQMTTARHTAIVTDSTVSLPPDLAASLGIVIVPLGVDVGDRTYHDGVDITPGELYRMLRQGAPQPTTSSPSPGDFLAAYRQAAQTAQGILCLTLTSRLSSAYDSARTARDLFSEESPQATTAIRVLDSGTAAGGLAALVVATARTVPPSASLDEVEATALRLKDSAYMLALLDTLQYVARGGHVPRVAAWAGDLLRVKPILEMAPGGDIHMLERPRTRHRALDRMLALARHRAGDTPVLANIIHADALAEAQALQERVSREMNCADIILTEFSPVIGSHTGPGLVGLAFCPLVPAERAFPKRNSRSS